MDSEAEVTLSRTADDFVVVSKPKKGIAFVEARFKNDDVAHNDKGCKQVRRLLRKPHRSPSNYSQILELLKRELGPEKLNDDTVISLESDLLKDTVLYKDVPRDLFHSLRVVEFQGLDPATRVVAARDVAIKINFYNLSTEAPINDENQMITVLPHTKLDGLWEFLDLEAAVRSQLSRWVMNHGELPVLPPSAAADSASAILLLGSAGSGKSILAQALAQKIAISLSQKYEKTLLHDRNAAQLFDFKKLAKLATAEPTLFRIVIIDDVESIAWPRTREEGDSSVPQIRTTNFCLAGLDMLSRIPNVLVICTSTMGDKLDKSFRDRCGIIIRLTLPTAPRRYDMLRRQFQAYIDGDVIACKDKISSYGDASLDTVAESVNPGVQILALARAIPDHASARFVGQMVTQALMSHLLHIKCDMTKAVGVVLRYLNRWLLSNHFQLAFTGHIDAESVEDLKNAGVDLEDADVEEGTPKFVDPKFYRSSSMDPLQDEHRDLAEHGLPPQSRKRRRVDESDAEE
ncbi:thyroid receptor-interacting protein 13 [Colletotrichum plurivorum]|uniref:Thyroid receptor-interacting protein 13 n=1 Tax=Colletotrichum plurivorum TaxID=2175906 RepID=A0A8H6K242_9PEZI|nr:thyroid receptor-interacting protein 13 [Colletotrichum plurivorum]